MTNKTVTYELKVDTVDPIGALYFNLSDPYQREEFETALKAGKYKRFYDELYDEVFRPYFKYNKSFLDIDDNDREKETAIIEAIYQRIVLFKEDLD